jgi:hypothetical protein
MKRPVGVLALAILAAIQGVYQVYITLIWLGVVGFEFVGRSVKLGEASWGQALLAGILALIYFAVAYGFWTMRVWSWIYGVLITGFNLFWLTLAVLGPTLTLEAVILPILVNLLIFAYLYAPGMRAQFAESEGARMDAIMDARQSGTSPVAAPPPPPAAPPPPSGPDTSAGGTGS